MSGRHDFFTGKRPWSLIKDDVLRGYLPAYLGKVNSIGQQILLVDGYAGPGTFEDGKAGSPLIIGSQAEAHAKGNYHAFFINKSKQYHEKLTSIVARHGWSNAHTLRGDARQILEVLPGILRSQTVFLYLDPFGPTGCEFALMEPFLKRDMRASTEIVLMMHIPVLHRLAARKKVQEGKRGERHLVLRHERLSKFFGGDYWKEILWTDHENSDECNELLVKEYCRRLNLYLPFSGYCPVHEAQSARMKYYVVFVSRHPDAMVLMNDAMAKAYHEYLHKHYFNENSLWGEEPWYTMRSANGFEDDLEAIVTEAVQRWPGLTREELWTKIITEHFMQYTSSEYKRLAEDLVNSGELYCPTPRKTKKLNDSCRLYPPPPAIAV
jgi:three-Cys-motif partner protein